MGRVRGRVRRRAGRANVEPLVLRARERLLHVVVVVFVVVLVVVLVVVFVVVVVVGIRGSAVQEEVLSILLILSREKSVVHIPRIGVEHVVLGVSLARHERAVSPSSNTRTRSGSRRVRYATVTF